MSPAACVSGTKGCLKQVLLVAASASEHDRSDLFSIYVLYLSRHAVMYHVVGEFAGALESYT
jgi:hypothetical protein